MKGDTWTYRRCVCVYDNHTHTHTHNRKKIHSLKNGRSFCDWMFDGFKIAMCLLPWPLTWSLSLTLSLSLSFCLSPHHLLDPSPPPPLTQSILWVWLLHLLFICAWNSKPKCQFQYFNKMNMLINTLTSLKHYILIDSIQVEQLIHCPTDTV